jgi:UDP:flavonoid glycosyltransferase YjiC (YdhE family)
VPLNLEQEILARRIGELGAGVTVGPRQTQAVFRETAELMNSDAYRQAAGRLAARHRPLSPGEYTARFVAALDEVAAG